MPDVDVSVSDFQVPSLIKIGVLWSACNPSETQWDRKAWRTPWQYQNTHYMRSGHDDFPLRRLVRS